MTRIYLHSTDPEIAARMKPEIYRRILEKREKLKTSIDETWGDADTITLEIGCGHGHFLTTYSKTFPEEVCVGIDVNRGRIYKALRKKERAGLTNLYFYECDSMEFLALLPQSVRIHKTWILYPDPWPKKRHIKNRIIQSRFLENLGSVMQADGILYLRSDYEPYLDWSRELIQASSNWGLQETFEWPELTKTVFQELTKNRHYSLAAQLKPLKQGHKGKLS